MRQRYITPLLLVGAALVAAGCGSDEETEPSIPPETAQVLKARLDEVQRRFDVGGGACNDIANDSQPAVQSILASLPSSVDADVRSALDQSSDRLFELTAEQCDAQEETTTPTETETVPETDTSDTTETEPTETQPTETVPPETQPTETTPVPPAEEGDEGDDGDGGGAEVPGL